jgi:hypothetical protein
MIRTGGPASAGDGSARGGVDTDAGANIAVDRQERKCPGDDPAGYPLYEGKFSRHTSQGAAALKRSSSRMAEGWAGLGGGGPELTAAIKEEVDAVVEANVEHALQQIGLAAGPGTKAASGGW